MNDHLNPHTYWEKRVNLLEQVVDKLLRVLISELPRAYADQVAELGNSWNHVTKELEAAEDNRVKLSGLAAQERTRHGETSPN